MGGKITGGNFLGQDFPGGILQGSHHICKGIWVPEIGESLDLQIEPNNPVNKHAACMRKTEKVVGHLKNGAAGRFAKTIFFFLKGGLYLKAKTATSERRCNPGEGLQVPCKLKLVGLQKCTDLLQDELVKLKEI